jgi:hypothetical protein
MTSPVKSTYAETIDRRLAGFDWATANEQLDAQGFFVLERLLTTEECDFLRSLYSQDDLFRSRVVMKQHNFGSGEYKYFQYPLPKLVGEIRSAAYPYLVETANRWNKTLGLRVQYPLLLEDFLKRCHRAGQTRPTPLLLSYGPEDYNCLHQDLYGEHAFPLQLTVLLSSEREDFSGGEFVLVEQRPRMQSRPSVVPLRQGDAVVFAVQNRPVEGKRGPYRVMLRHGVSRVRSGSRYTLGVIFHDAR